MVSLTSLWLPIVLAAVIVFLASWVLHMLLTYHRADYKKLPGEAETLAEMRKFDPPPGYYMFPHCESHKDMANPEVQEKFRTGPVGVVTVFPKGMPQMGKYLGTWFVFTLLVSLFAGYLASRTLPATTHYLAVFRVVGASAFLAYGLGELPSSIWKGQPWANTFRTMFDGLVYALLTAGTFGWLWPR
ncbi:MAG: hypothetical protein KDB94_04170 [Acidobacteria bacterium]|nr:hypothetical protein [Acidobacteriota bacterium]MCB9377358.1 hypothetical protein [Holophagales bacterium]